MREAPEVYAERLEAFAVAVETYRSGFITGRLRRGPCFCVTGLMCERYRQANPQRGAWHEAFPGNWHFYTDSNRSVWSPPREVYTWFGMMVSQVDRLTESNDRRASPVELAAMIRSFKDALTV